jgi:hypothetical protein
MSCTDWSKVCGAGVIAVVVLGVVEVAAGVAMGAGSSFLGVLMPVLSMVNTGDELSADDSIITLESDKASMEIPTPLAGKVIDISVSLGVCGAGVIAVVVLGVVEVAAGVAMGAGSSFLGVLMPVL